MEFTIGWPRTPESGWPANDQRAGKTIRKLLVLNDKHKRGNSCWLLPPDRLRVLSVPPLPAEAPSLQGDCSSEPLTTTWLLSGRSSAAFRGLMELKSTAERQPIKPEEAGRGSCGSNSESGERGQERDSYYIVIQFHLVSQEFSPQGWWTSWKNPVVCWPSESRLFRLLRAQQTERLFLAFFPAFLTVHFS